MTKVLKDEKFEEDDWNDIAELVIAGLTWLYENSSVVVTPETNQVHVQPKDAKSSHKKKKQQKD